MAGALPMLVLTLGLVLGPQVGSRWASMLLGILGFGSLVGFILALWLFRAIQANIALLKEATWAYGAKRDDQQAHDGKPATEISRG